MTTLLEQAFQKASKLPEALQDELAQEILDEMVWEMKWESSFSESFLLLDAMAKQALDLFDSGETEEKGFDQL